MEAAIRADRERDLAEASPEYRQAYAEAMVAIRVFGSASLAANPYPDGASKKIEEAWLDDYGADTATFVLDAALAFARFRWMQGHALARALQQFLEQDTRPGMAEDYADAFVTILGAWFIRSDGRGCIAVLTTSA